MYIIVGIFYIVAGFFVFTYLIKSNKDMQTSVFGFVEDQYNIINIEKFINLIIIQSTLITVFFFSMAIIVLYTKKSLLLLLAPAMILVNILMKPFIKKYIAIKK